MPQIVTWLGLAPAKVRRRFARCFLGGLGIRAAPPALEVGAFEISAIGLVHALEADDQEHTHGQAEQQDNARYHQGGCAGGGVALFQSLGGPQDGDGQVGHRYADGGDGQQVGREGRRIGDGQRADTEHHDGGTGHAQRDQGPGDDAEQQHDEVNFLNQLVHRRARNLEKASPAWGHLADFRLSAKIGNPPLVCGWVASGFASVGDGAAVLSDE